MPYPVLADLIGKGIQTVGSWLGTKFQASQQASLLRNQYDEYFRAANRAGATPAAIAQGVTGSGPSSTPSVSAPSMPDLTPSQSMAVSSENALRDMQTREIEQAMQWNPKKWSADIKKVFSEINNNMTQAEVNKGLVRLNKEYEETARQSMPWQIKRLIAGLQNDLAQYDLILAQTKTELKKPSLIQSEIERNQAETSNLRETNVLIKNQVFEAQFANTIRRSGYDPTKSPWENLIRLSMTNPYQFKSSAGLLLRSFTTLDNVAKNVFGKRYKEKALAGFWTYKALNNGANFGMDILKHHLTNPLGGVSPSAGALGPASSIAF